MKHNVSVTAVLEVFVFRNQHWNWPTVQQLYKRLIWPTGLFRQWPVLGNGAKRQDRDKQMLEGVSVGVALIMPEQKKKPRKMYKILQNLCCLIFHVLLKPN